MADNIKNVVISSVLGVISMPLFVLRATFLWFHKRDCQCFMSICHFNVEFQTKRRDKYINTPRLSFLLASHTLF